MTSRDRLSGLLAATAVASSVFALGGATRWAAAIVALVVAAAVAVQLPSRRVFGRWPPAMILFGVTGLCTLVQLLPLPEMLVYSVSPTIEALRRDGTEIAGVASSATLTADVPGSLRALTFSITLAGIAFVALRLAISERGRYWLVASVAGTAGVAAVVAGLHKLFGATSLYGVYTPLQASPPIMGPLLNSNHFGCLMAVGAVCSAGLFLYAKQSTMRRTIWAAAAASCVLVTLATVSRGAIVALAAGTFVLVATLVAQRFQASDGERRERKERLLTRTLPIGILVLCSLVLAVYMSASSVMHQLDTTSLQELKNPHSKYAAWRSSFVLLEESPWTGTGRGAFEPAFTRVHAASALVTFSHLENESLQALVEWGIPVTIVLAAIAGWLLLLGLRRWNDGPLAAGALGAIMVVAFQSNFDFGIELLGLAVPVTVLIASLTYVPIEESKRRLVKARIARGALTLILAGAALALLIGPTQSLDEDHRAIEADPSMANIQAAIERHPLDYFGYAQLAQHFLKTTDPRGVSALNHALRLHPTHPGLHRIAARLLVRSGRLAQAESEYATALRGSRDPRPVLTEIVAQLTPDRAAAAIPLELDIDTIVTLLSKSERGDVALLWLERVVAHRQDLHAAEVMFSLATERKDLALAERAARIRCSVVRSAQCRLALARVLSAAKKHKELLIELKDVSTWRGHRDAQVEAWFLLCDAHVAVGTINDARYCLRRLQGSGLIKPDDVQKKIDDLAPAPPG